MPDSFQGWQINIASAHAGIRCRSADVIAPSVILDESANFRELSADCPVLGWLWEIPFDDRCGTRTFGSYSGFGMFGRSPAFLSRRESMAVTFSPFTFVMVTAAA